MKKYIKKCKGCGSEFTPFTSFEKYCGWSCHNSNEKPKEKKVYKKPNQVSKKQSIINSKYSVARIQFLGKKENKVCFVDGCNKGSNTVEHRKGRGQGFFDVWAEQNNICKTLDTRYWAGCCLEHNLELENNPELSKKYQLSKLHDGKKQ